MAEYQSFKPQKNSFILTSFIPRLIVRGIVHIGILVVIFSLFGLNIGAFATAGLVLTFLGLTALQYYFLTIRYAKHEYQFYHNKIIVVGGSILSDFQSELIIKNITHVSHKRPYLWHKIFGIGHISIDAAGSSGIHLSDLDNSTQLFLYVEKLMSKNGFSLKKTTLLQEEQPNKLAVVIEISKMYIAILVFLFFAGFSSLIPLLITAFTNPVVALLILFVLVLTFLAAIVFGTFSFLDLSRRTYRVYSDTITYDEGFLTKVSSFVPLENVSDSSLNQSFIDKLLNLYDVRVSCQGSGKEILFKNMNNGEELEENIDSAIKKHKTLASKKILTKTHITKSASVTAKKTIPSPKSTAFTGQFNMDMKRSLFIFYFVLPLSLLGGPLFIVALIGFITVLIRAKKSEFYIKEQSIQSTYSFLSKERVEFSIEKITSIEFKKSFIDRIFDTVSINFYSIGSSENVVFANIKEKAVDKAKILEKIGIRPSEVKYTITPDFTLGSYFAINAIGLIFFLLLLSTSVVVASIYSPYFYVATVLLGIFFIIQLVYLFMKHDRMSISFMDGYLCYKEGIIFKTQLYVVYDSIKDTQTSHIFFLDKGKITCNIAGEKIVGAGKNKTTVSHNFTLPYVNGINRMDDLFDYVFLTNPSKKDLLHFADSSRKLSDSVVFYGASSKNALLTITIISVIIFPLLLILPFTLFLAHLVQSKKSFVLDTDRVLYKKGVLFKFQQSVLYKKIDSIDNSQGMFNKLFDNGNIVVNTAGSSAPEMVLTSVIEFRSFYDKLKEFYK